MHRERGKGEGGVWRGGRGVRGGERREGSEGWGEEGGE